MNRNTILLSFFLCCVSLPLYSQSFGNEWYQQDPDRPYIALQVGETGIYRVSQADLLTAGYDLSGVNPFLLHLYYRGEEQAMYVQRTSGNQLNYLEFYGRRNDGAVDALLYRDPLTGLPNPDLQPQPALSLFSDTSTYFLTWDGTAGLRYQTFLATDYQNYSPEPSVPFEVRQTFHPADSSTQYSKGGGGIFDSFYQLNTDYVTGEGYVGPYFSDTVALNWPLWTPWAANAGTIDWQVRVFGASNSPHQLKIRLNQSTVLDTSLLYSQVYLKTYAGSSSLSQDDTTWFTLEALRTSTDENYLCGINVVYERLPQWDGASQFRIPRWGQAGNRYFQFSQVGGTDSLYLYDPTQHIRSKGVIGPTQQGHLLAPLTPQSKDLLLVSESGIRSPLIASPPLHKLCHPDSGATFVMIAPRSLQASAEAFAAYRDTNQHNPVPVKLVYLDEIYAEFGYGSPTPLAIKRFLNCAMANWSLPPQYLLLWGKGDNLLRDHPDNLLPNYGYPASDWEFVRPMNETLTITLPVAVGRIPVRNDAQGFAFLDKVRQLERSPWEAWRQEGLFLRGGATLGEQSAIQIAMSQVIYSFQGFPYFGSATLLTADSLGSPDPVGAGMPLYDTLMNRGVGVIHYFGHSITALGEVSLGQPEDYSNWDRPVCILGFGGDNGYGTDSLSALIEEWLLTPERGSIAYLGMSGPAYLNPIRELIGVLFPHLFDSHLSFPMGEAVRQTLNVYADSLVGIQYRNHARQTLLLGDPSMVLFQGPNIPLNSVYPGDANQDGVADLQDLLHIGLAFGDSATARTLPSLAWEAQAAVDWPTFFADGLNHKHADCNGDGRIDAADTLAIRLNYQATHNKETEHQLTQSGLPVYLLYPQTAAAGDTIQITIHLGDSSQLANLYGLYLSIGYDTSLLSPRGLSVQIDSSWLGQPGQDLLSMYQVHSEEGSVQFALTRTDQQLRQGMGKIGDINIVITDDIAKKDWVLDKLSLQTGFAQDASGHEIPLSSGQFVAQEEPLFGGQARIFPNPLPTLLTVDPNGFPVNGLALYDLQGRLVARHSETLINQPLQWDLSALRPGTYLLHYRQNERWHYQKIMVR